MRILIVEDEQLIALRLERLIKAEASDELASIDRCASLNEAELWLEKNPVDVVFLDLNLNGQDGFDLVKNITARSFHTVVVSAHTQRALEAFEIGVLDFVGKPFGADRIRKTLDRLRGTRTKTGATLLAVRIAGRIDLIPVADIAFVRAAGTYSELVLRDGSVHLHSKSLDRLLAVLPLSFERIHRSFLVPVNDIRQIRVSEGSRYAAILDSGEEIPIGRTRIDAVRKRLGML